MSGPDPESLLRAAAWLRSARRVVVFSGAGISAESGIPTFRDDDGLWQRFPPERFANWPGLLREAVIHPARLAEFVAAVLEPIAGAEPNEGHRAIAALEKHVDVTVVTQNVDGLHQAAGSSRVLEIHGSMFETCTLRGRRPRPVSRATMLSMVERLRSAAASRYALPRLLLAVRPLVGLGLRGFQRPNVVLFGQGMAEPAWSQAVSAARDCDLMLVVGTSGMIQPAATLPYKAAWAGAKVIGIGPQEDFADVWLQAPAGRILPELVKASFGP